MPAPTTLDVFDFGTEITALIPTGDQSSEHLGAPNHDGDFFRKIAGPEKSRLLALAALADRELESNADMPEDVKGRLRSASGQARLLAKERFGQFDGLCEDNLNPKPGDKITGPLDLAGFWDLILIEVNSIQKIFLDIKTLKENNWILLSQTQETPVLVKKAQGVKKSSNAKNGALSKERDLARKKKMDELRKMKSKIKSGDDVEILIGSARKSSP